MIGVLLPNHKDIVEGEQIKDKNMKKEYCNSYEIGELEGYIASLEAENESLSEALELSQQAVERLENELRSYKKPTMDRETIRRIKQENCDHEYVGENWVDSCFYTKTCRKCGKVKTFYERD